MTPKYLTAQKPLILLPPTPSIDKVSAAYALAHFYTSIDVTEPVIVCEDDCTKIVPFLTQPRNVTTTIGGLQDFIIQFDTTHNPISDVKVLRTDTAINISVTPEKDFIDPRDFSFAPAQMHYDAIIVIGAQTLEDTNLATPENTALLAELPTTYLMPPHDIPLVSMSLYADISAYTSDISHETAQSLLTGIVAGTDGLRSSHVTADIFRAGSALMRSKADLQEIMLTLYKTVSFDFLRLWGGFLNKLTLHASGKVATATITPLYEDDPNLLSLILTRTAQFLPQADVIIALWSKASDTQTHGMIYSPSPEIRTQLPALFAHATNAPNSCISIHSPETQHDILTNINRTLGIPQK